MVSILTTVEFFTVGRGIFHTPTVAHYHIHTHIFICVNNYICNMRAGLSDLFGKPIAYMP